MADTAVASASVLTRERSSPFPAHVGVAIVTGIAMAFYVYYSLGRFTTYRTAGYDLGIFDQVVRDYAHFRAPIVPLKGISYNVFGDHFHPIIAVLAPFYWVWNTPQVLLVAQAVLLSASIPIVYRFTLRRAGSTFALIVAISYAAGWPIMSMIDADFHEIAFAVPLLAWAIDALDRRADRELLLCAALLLFVREDMGLLVAGLGILRVAFRPRKPLWLGWSMVGTGIAMAAVVMAVIQPAFSPTDRFEYWQYDALGRDLPHAVGSVIIHPWHAIRLFFTPWPKTQTLLYLFVPTAFLSLRSRYAWLLVPLLAERFFNSRDTLWTTHYHYSVLPWVIVVLAMVDGAARLGLFRQRVLVGLLSVWLLVVPYHIAYHPGPTPAVVLRARDRSDWLIDNTVRNQQAAAAQIPRNVCVEVDDRIAPHLTPRDYVTLPGMQHGTSDFIVLDMSRETTGYLAPTPQAALASAQADGYRQIFRRGPMLVLQSPTYQGPSARCHP